MTQLGVVVRKELLDAVRDRRSLASSLLVAAAVGPLVVLLVFGLVSRNVDGAAEAPLRVAGLDRAPGLARFFERQQVEVEEAPADYVAQVRDGTLDVVVEVPPTLEEDVAAGRVVRLRLHLDDSRDRSQAAVSRARALLGAFDRQWGEARLVTRGVSPEVARPTAIDTVNHATPQQSGSRLLFLIGFFAISATMVGGLAPALDASAGEREHGSLEPLLATPVSPLALAVGKWLAIVALDLAVLAVTLAGFQLVILVAPAPKLGVPFVFGLHEVAWFALLLAPLAAMFPAVQLAVGSFGRTVKEAQTNHGVVLVGMQLLPLANLLLSGRTPAWLPFVPISGHSEALLVVLRGEPVSAVALSASWAVPLAVAAAAVGVFAHRLGRESVLSSR